MKYDIAVIGAGISGAMIARTLSKYNRSIVVLEKEHDVAMGSSMANSGIVHAGYDPAPGTLKAFLNVEGCRKMEQTASELRVAFERNGSMVAAFSPQEAQAVQELYHRGRANGVVDLQILGANDVYAIEPNLAPGLQCALFAPAAGIVCPYSLTIAAMGNAMDNGVKLITDFQVTGIVSLGDGFEIYSGEKSVTASYIVNAAGLFGDSVARMAGDGFFTLHPRKGQYYLYDKSCPRYTLRTVFRAPGPMGKGVLVTPTVNGNTLIGPTAENIDDKDDKSTTKQGLDYLLNEARKTVPALGEEGIITAFSGLRAVGETGDFIIAKSPAGKGILHVGAIDSPGLASSPAIADYVEKLLREEGVLTHKRKAWNPNRSGVVKVSNYSGDELRRILEYRPDYGRIVCRCEEVSEGEIVDAIRMNPGARDLDGIKRRTRCGMGRCQSGFCLPPVAEILSREMGIPIEQITKKGQGSELVTGKTK